jgi:hypothetical protein
MERPPLNALQVFVTAAREGNMTRAHTFRVAVAHRGSNCFQCN